MQTTRVMGEGYEPYVEKLGDKLIYSLPVESGFVSFYFEFDILKTDLDVLLSDHYRRAVLEVTAHTLLQHSTLKGHKRFTQNDFDNLIATTLHASQEHLSAFISQINREHNISIEHYVNDIVNTRITKG
ncbi:hypothetical protein ACV275_004109 [Enterobacter cloacae]|uniref:hypothetical protein n=1 Tax=Enterobacter TaxID=547 RepID=UPI000267FEA7|nr:MULTISPECIES: hypothetical protein [Enterobacter]EBW8988426.1 hypothetical protein [Salmonella enterica subsp. enterica serovar Enteritidis]AFM58899.1 hypothetical protein A3UG_05790 [Enterobacter cloacae subsp. dissolvens SDM]ELV2784891.1 hypothetical protein [Enterobacter cloacae]MCK7269386.1 hypothetical protein [Enterobacter cloacae]PAN69360.1 hypothetical protein CIW70_16535 [Enterobacter cloacae]